MTNAPQYQSAPGQQATPADYPGKTLGLVGFILSILVPVVGLILSIIARSQSKNAGFENKWAKIGIIVGIILTILGIIGFIINMAVLLPMLQQY